MDRLPHTHSADTKGYLLYELTKGESISTADVKLNQIKFSIPSYGVR